MMQGCFHVLASVNSAAMNMLGKEPFFFFLSFIEVQLQSFDTCCCTTNSPSNTYAQIHSLSDFFPHKLLGIYPEKIIIQKDVCTPVFIAALFTIAKT